uniref:Trinucleotide repeat-containing gene 6B protein-like n=1 Tax=Hippocampus comes TaxID=109280 RepID=A0A3Q2Z981_HIPCM
QKKGVSRLEQSFMEDKKRKKEEKRKREASQKVYLTKQSSAHPPANQSSSASPSPGPSPSASPSPATSGPGSAAAQSQGGNNANSSSQPRYMPREVPPRFRCQQDHKVLLKRGQPPLSSMLLGGGGGGGGGGGDPPNANTAAVSGMIAASTTTSNYANSMWGTSLGSQASSQGREKVIVDGNDLEEWPSIAGSDGGGASFTVAGGGGGGSSSSNSNGMPVNSTSASGNQSSSTSLFSLPNECMQSSSSVQSSSVSKAAAVPGSHDASGLVDGSSGIPGANFNPNANPSAWPALVQQDAPGVVGEGGPSSFHHQGTGGTLSANNSASVGLKAGAVALGGHQALSVNQSSTHQHQLHQMQSRDREMAGGKWDSESAGPKIAGEEGVAGGMGGGGDHNLSSSWRGQPSYPASNSKTGASRTDGWEGREGGTGSYRAAEGDNGSSGWGYLGPSSGVKSWGSAGNGANDSQTGVSQGGWGTSGAGVEKGMSSVDWGGSSSSTGGAHPGEVRGGACSSNSSSSGCSTAGNPPVTSTAMNRAWDNQKGEGETGEWGEGGHGARGGSLSSGGNSRCEREHNGSRPRRQPPDTEAALQNLLSRPDLDPRVLSNTGWGQTQIRQNTAWDLGNQAEHSKSALSSTSSKHPASLGHSSQYSNLGVSQSGAVITAGTGGSSGSLGQNEQGKTTGWGAGGMGAVDSQETKGWDNEGWRTNRGNGGSWGGLGEQGSLVSTERGAVGWKEMGGEGRGSGWGSGQKVGAGRDWGEQESKSNSSGAGWEDEPKNGGRNSGAGRNKMHQMPNSQSGSIAGLQAQLQQQQSQPRNQPPQLQQALDQGAMQGGGGRKPISQAQNQSSGWTSGPIPAGHGGSGSAPSGWEEPSPQSLSRKNEIDDGTSAWGDPTHYNYKPVNLWDKNTTPAGQQPHGSKSMQDSWGEKEGSVTASRHSSWEEEEEGGSMWNSAGSQGSGSSWGQGSNGGWGQSHNVKNGLNIDLAPGALQEKKMEMDKRALGMMDYNGDMRKGRGGGSMAYRSPVSKEAAPGDGVSFYDKVCLCISNDIRIILYTSSFLARVMVPPFSFIPSLSHSSPVPRATRMSFPRLSLGQTLLLNNQDGYLGEDGPCSLFSPPTACQLLLQQQQQPQQQLLQNQRKFTPNVRQQADPQQVHACTERSAAIIRSISLFFLHPQEFQPGVPWKGIDRVDPESDPYMTPGSMMGNTVSPCLNDTEHQLLQDNTDSIPPLNTLLPSPGAWPYSASDPLNNAHNSAKYTDYKTGWPPEPIGHKSWKANRGSSQAQLSRPPPGLASQKQILPTPWSGGGPRLAGRGWSSGSGTSGSAWSDGSSRESCWLVLSNLTPQIDGSTLRTICMQHGPLLTFHLGLTQGSALIRYGSKQEAAKAQSALHMCVLGNTTILAKFVSEEDVAQYIAHSQAGGSASGGAGTGSGTTPAPSSAVGANGSGANCGGVEAGRHGLWGGMGGMSGAGYPSSSLWGSPALEDRHQMGSPASLLPGDLLGGNGDSI